MRWHWDRRFNLENIGKYPLQHLGAVVGWLVLAAVIALLYTLVQAMLPLSG